MKNLLKKTTCFLLAFLLFAGTAAFNPSSVNAAITSLNEPSLKIANAGTPVTESFTVAKPCEVGILIYVEMPTAFTMTVYNSADAIIDTFQVTASDPYWTSYNNLYVNGGTYDLAAGDYSVSLTFDATTEFILAISSKEADATISNESITLTAGFTKTLSVSDNTGKVTWSSSNNSIATVNSNGKVTAKKAGKCTITASVDGQNLKCAVTVKNNKYTAAKLTNSQIPNGQASWEAYSASYTSNGDLTIKFRMVNNSGHYSEYLKNLSVKVKTAEGKTVATYKASKKNLRVSDQSYKDFSITIKKADLKIKKADLRNATITTAGKYGYTYYTYY